MYIILFALIIIGICLRLNFCAVFAKKLPNFSTKIIKKIKQFYKSLIIIKKKFYFSYRLWYEKLYLCNVKLSEINNQKFRTMKETSKKEIEPFLVDDDGMKYEIGRHHFHNIYDNDLNYGGQFVDDTRDGDYIRLGNMGLYEEKDVKWWKRHNGHWVRCGRKEEKILEEIQEHKARLAELKDSLLFVK